MPVAELPQIGDVGTKLHHEVIRIQLSRITQISTKTPPAFRWEIDFRELNILTSVSMSTIRDRKVQTETLIFSQISQYGFSFPFLVTIRTSLTSNLLLKKQFAFACKQIACRINSHKQFAFLGWLEAVF